MSFPEALREITIFAYPLSGEESDAEAQSRGMLEPYKRIVGIRFDDFQRQEMWEPEFQYFGNTLEQYHKAHRFYREMGGRSEGESLTVTPRMMYGLMAFFGEHLRDREARRQFFNCHLFAQYLCELPFQDRGISDTEAPARLILESGEKRDSERLKLGEIGVIGYKHEQNAEWETVHSLVGLGEDGDEFLQVVCTGGYVAISSYSSALHTNIDPGASEYYKNPTLGLYSPAESGSS